MYTWAFDTEFVAWKRVVYEVPPLVCLTYVERGNAPTILLRDDGLDMLQARLTDRTCRLVGMNVPVDLTGPAVERPSLLPLIFDALDDDRITDIMNREKLADIAKGCLREEIDPETGKTVRANYKLEDITFRHLGFKPAKGADTYRRRYGEFRDARTGRITPLHLWPKAAIDYALFDPDITDQAYYVQAEKYGTIPTEYDAARKAFALHLVSCWGFKVDAARVEKLDREIYLKRETSVRRLLELALYRREIKSKRAAAELQDHLGGLFEVAETGPDLLAVLDVAKEEPEIQALVAKAYEKPSQNNAYVTERVVAAFAARGLEAPRNEPTEKALEKGKTEGSVTIDRDALLMSKDPELKELADSGKIRTAANVFLPALRNGVKFGRLYGAYDPLVSTGRTSCYGPKSPKDVKDPATGKQIPYGFNFQQAPADMGVRECLVADEGTALVSVDYKAQELTNLAQAVIDVCGISPRDCAMAVAINAGKDLHLDLAAVMLGISYEEAVRRHAAGDKEVTGARKRAKPGNFGLGGLMGLDGFINYSRRQYGVIFERHEAKHVIDSWYAKWPEQRKYQAVCKQIARREGVVILPRCGGFVRGVAGRAPAACNTGFQTPAGYGAGMAIYALIRECFARPGLPLFGSRMNAFVHDETIMTHPLNDLTRRANRQAQVMVDVMQPLCPDVKVSVDKPAAMLWWSKKAEAVIVDGELVPYETRRAA